MVRKTALAALTALLITPTAARAAPNPTTCQDYPQQRVFLEAQSWWGFLPGDTGDDFGHAHMGACVPIDSPSAAVTGDLHVDWVVKFHGNPGYIKRIEAEISTTSGDIGLRSIFTGDTSWACPVFDCTWVVPTDFDTTVSPVDGRQQYQPRMPVREPDGNNMRPSLRFPFWVDNGRPRVDNTSSTNVPLGYGWFGPDNSNAGYAWARLDSGVPQAPVSGLWSFRASFLSDGGGKSVTHYRIAVDPDIHHGDLGTTIVDAQTGCTAGTNGCNGPRKQTFTIDTGAFENGPHKLFLETDAFEPVRGSTNSGVFVVPFTVAN